MLPILALIHSKIKGFILGYCLYLLIFLFSFTALISQAIYAKAQIERNLLEIEKQKCIELVLYSYFTNNISEDTFTISENDYIIDYNSYTKKNKVYLDAKITNDDNSYTVRYIYNKDSNYVESIEYLQ